MGFDSMTGISSDSSFDASSRGSSAKRRRKASAAQKSAYGDREMIEESKLI